MSEVARLGLSSWPGLCPGCPVEVRDRHWQFFNVMAGEACPGEGREPAIHVLVCHAKTWMLGQAPA